MKTPAALAAAATRFDRMTLRERLLIAAAALVLITLAWQSSLMEPLWQREKNLSLELTDLQDSVARLARTTEAVAAADPTSLATRKLEERQQALDAINAKLAAASAALVPADQMVQVIHEVLKAQHDLRLVSLRNLPVTTLAPSTGPGEVETGPYLHPVELVIEGRYVDVVAYLHALEGLPWHFYWRVLELETRAYPLNRVRIELSTLSLDKEWIGV